MLGTNRDIKSYICCKRTFTVTSESTNGVEGTWLEPAECPVVTVEFDNRTLFGAGDADVFDDVYPRYRGLRAQWWDALREAGLPVVPDGGRWIRPHPVPVAAAGGTEGETLPKPVRSSRSIRVVELDTVPATPYLTRMRHEYGLTHGIADDSGHLFDLDEALLLAVDCAATEFGELTRFVDVGSGTGSASALAMTRARAGQVLANDFHEAIGNHLRDHLGKLGAARGTGVEVVTGDCRDLTYPPGTTLLAVSTVFGQQPSLLARRGPGIAASLGTQGVAVFASSMVDMPFYQNLTEGGDERLGRWPWYPARTTLRRLFPRVRVLRLRNLVATLAGGPGSPVDAIAARMADRGAAPLHVAGT